MSSSESRIVIVGCGFPQLSLIRTARKLGLHVIGTDLNPDAIGVRDCNDFVPLSTNDIEGLSSFLQSSQIRAIATTGSEVSLKTTAHVAARLELPFYADPETIRRCQEKDAMRSAYAAANVPVPPFRGCATIDEAWEFVHQHGYPVVLKPARGWGQRGVARVDTEQEMRNAFPLTQEHARSAGLETVVIEAWLQGEEFSVNGWVDGGELTSYCVTYREKVPGKYPLGVMLHESSPSGLFTAARHFVIEEARRGAQALGLTRGPCYSQVAITMDPEKTYRMKTYLFETAARTGGGFDADLTRLVSGVDLYKRILGVATGNVEWERAGVEHEKHNAAMVHFVIAQPGHVRAIHGLEATRALPGIELAEVFVPVGGQVHPLTDSSKRAAVVLAYGNDMKEVEARTQVALQTLRIETEPV